jgi:polyribonucleotide nucleotidyltransferase
MGSGSTGVAAKNLNRDFIGMELDENYFKIAKERINHVEDVLTLGDMVTVVCLGKDKMGRISFSIKDVH